MSKSKIQQKTNVMPPFQLYSHGNSLTKTINNGAQRKKDQMHDKDDWRR